MGLSHSPSIVTNGMIFCLDAANQKSYPGSANNWYDLSGNGYTGTLVDGTSFSSNNYGTLVFDGNANRVHGTNTVKWSADGTVGYQRMTIEVMVKTSDATGNIVSRPWNGSGQYNIIINTSSFTLVAGANTATQTIDSSLYNGSWQHLFCWMDGVNMGYYLNGGKFSGSKAHNITANIPSSGDSNQPVCLMSLYPYNSGWAGNASFSIQGSLAFCRFYNRVLTSSEMTQNFNALRGRFGL
jgi:hypothetical protein